MTVERIFLLSPTCPYTSPTLSWAISKDDSKAHSCFCVQFYKSLEIKPLIFSQVAYLIYSCIGALIFSMYIVFDTQIMLGGKHKWELLNVLTFSCFASSWAFPNWHSIAPFLLLVIVEISAQIRHQSGGAHLCRIESLPRYRPTFHVSSVYRRIGSRRLRAKQSDHVEAPMWMF